jgi:hypothetical protein
VIPALQLDLQRIYAEQLEKALIFRQMFSQVNDAWGRTQDRNQAADLGWFLQDGYVAHQCLAVRKMMDPNPKSVSLLNVLEELKKPANLTIISRAAFCQKYPIQLQRPDIAERDFNSITDGDPELTDTRIDTHISDLNAATTPVKNLVNKVVAHTNRKPSPTVTFGDLNNAIDALHDMFNRYSLLLDGHPIDDGYISRSFDISDDIAKIWP